MFHLAKGDFAGFKLDRYKSEGLKASGVEGNKMKSRRAGQELKESLMRYINRTKH